MVPRPLGQRIIEVASGDDQKMSEVGSLTRQEELMEEVKRKREDAKEAQVRNDAAIAGGQPAIQVFPAGGWCRTIFFSRTRLCPVVLALFPRDSNHLRAIHKLCVVDDRTAV